MPNVENILKVADAIERHTIAELGFNMASFVGVGETDLSGHNCGTTACIGGWAAALATGDIHAGDDMSAAEIARWLGLTYHEAGALFYAWDRHDTVAFEEIQPERAVAVLRNLAATGEVDWNVRTDAVSA